jgi:uncharacterized protein (DUF2252 family)
MQRDGTRRLVLGGKHTLPVTHEERSSVETTLNAWASRQSNPAFFNFLDVARRIAGIGSLGVVRYIVLVEGKGSPDQNHLVDLKESRASALQPYLTWTQPQWPSQAERVLAIQQRMQGTCPALLSFLVMHDKYFLLRELQPTEDKVDLEDWGGKIRRLEKVIETMGQVIAWDQLRSTGRQGSAIADDLISFASARGWQEELLRYSVTYADQVASDYQEFCSNVP